MHCPYCGDRESRVVDSRDTEQTVRRRRECVSCNQRFTTYERTEPTVLRVIKCDGRREEFSRGKVMLGLSKACAKRPVSEEEIEKLVDEMELDLLGLGKAEVPSSEIGEAVMQRLRELDEVAYLRFASVYRHHVDLDGLAGEIDDYKAWKQRSTETKDQLSLRL